ncbi:MAG: helicase [Piccolia ochrophora]|nr:MAG: helicase [Piccolia ochrophora]
MLTKPFKPPSLIPNTQSSQAASDHNANGPPAKRQRLNADGPCERGPVLERSYPISRTIFTTSRKPLVNVSNVKPASDVDLSQRACGEAFYTVLWRKPTTKKHKTWDGDGVLSIRGGFALLQDVSGKHMGKVSYNSPLLPGSSLSVSGKDVEVDAVLPKDDYLSGKPFSKAVKQLSSTIEPPKSIPTTKLEPIAIAQKSFTPRNEQVASKEVKSLKTKAASQAPHNAIIAKTVARHNKFRNPLLSSTVLPKQDSSEPIPRHDPSHPKALVMTRPRHAPKGRQIVDVVVDPVLCKHLRDHQREGVKFLYECVMEMRPFDGQGAVLADDMGLGKTLQTIALLWTLLKQNPIYGEGPVIKKALIVCPVTLINNWRKEFRKWLGNEVIGVFVADGTKKSVRSFTLSKSYHVMIIGYEKLRNVQDDLRAGSGIDLVVADEGHRLKTAQNKSAQAIKSLNTFRRIILSGTPIQNDLSEFFEMVDFVNPGLLNKYSIFRREYEMPILKSRQPNALQKDVEKGEEKNSELAALTKMFILRRTAEVLAKYLPAKTEYVLLCKPTNAQAQVYQAVLSSPAFGRALRSSEASLYLITMLKKVCNSPTLIDKNKASKEAESNLSALISEIPASLLQTAAAVSSTKLRVLDRLLHHLRGTTSEKIVLVSNYTSTLDLLQTHLTAHSLPYLRLDGSTPSSKRQDLVDQFNRTPASICFAFLLSAKSGGTGLNLIGASRLILFDVDWNPSTDLQAMARIHRDGQKREVRIYRLLVAGALDEKIWQRQVTKTGLADSVMEQTSGTSAFSTDELHDLFTLDTAATCQTHDLLACPCGGNGTGITELPDDERLDADDDDADGTDDDLPAYPGVIRASQLSQSQVPSKRKRKAASMQSLMRYAHIDTSGFAGRPASGGSVGASVDEGESAGDVVAEREAMVDDEVLLKVLKEEGNRVRFLFAKTSS